MDKNSLSVCVALTLFTVISLASCGKAGKISPDDYLDWSKLDHKVELNEQIRGAMKKLLDLNWIKEGWDGRFMIERLDEARRSDEFSRDEREIYHKIFIVADGLDCDTEQIKVLQSLWVQVQLGELPKGLEPFVERIGTVMSMSCMSIYSSRKKGWVVDPEIVDQLDKVFAAALDKHRDRSCSSVDRLGLTKSLKEFDLETDAFNGKKMVSTLRAVSEDENAYQEEPFTLLKNFMLDRCDQFDASLSEAITVIDMSRKFHTDSNWKNGNLERLDEYNRLCLALQSPDKQESIRKNLYKSCETRFKFWCV